MPYRRRAYRRGRYGSRDKYSVHQKAFSFTAQASPTTTAQLIVPSSATEGMRKVKHLTVNLTPILDQDGGQIWWALVYVPQGTTAGSIQLATTAALSDMYEPNQYVMNCGIVDPTAGPIRFSSPISRNLNNGDAIVLLVRHTLGGNMDIRGTCRYAITPPVIFTLHLKFIFHMKFVGPVDVRSLNTPSGAVTLYRPFLSILIQKMEIGDGDYKEMWSSLCSIQPQGLGYTRYPYKYIGLGYW